MKCDLCMDELERGGKPVCAITCPTSAIRYCEKQEMEEIGKRARRARRMVGARLYAWRPT